MDRYGAGAWSQWLRFDAPLRLGEKGFLTNIRSTSSTYLMLQRGYPQRFPLTPWPAPGGFLPFGDSIVAWQRGNFRTEGLPSLDQDDDPLEFSGFTPFTHQDGCYG